MNMTRTYRMDTRRAAAEATRERILSAAVEAFLTRWYDEVTLQDVAAAAGVSGQTVINHFGGKEPLFAAAVARISEEIGARRDRAPAGDLDALIAALIEDYEITGDATIRLLALEHRVEQIAPLLAEGRGYHRDWVRATFGRPDLLPELVVATDVYTWKLLRRDQGLSADATRDSVRRTVLALLALEPETDEETQP
jgi:AcrR family transcriptional regulator